MTKIIAHRGYSLKYPENTIAAFEAAYEERADGIEIDVHLTKDGEVVICHDEKIDRTSNGTGFIKDYSMKELKAFDFGANSPEGDVYHQHQEERIMTLREYFEWMQGKNLITMIELKTNIFPYEGIEEKVNNLIMEFDQQQYVVLSSFNHYSVMNMKKINPALTCGFLTSFGLLEPGKYCRKYGVEYYHPNYYMVEESMLADCRENEVKLNVWTINDAEKIKEMLALEVPGIITDDPKLAKKLKNELLLK